MKRKHFTVEHHDYYAVTFNRAKDSSGEGELAVFYTALEDFLLFVSLYLYL